jgi:hypothetical protein
MAAVSCARCRKPLAPGEDRRVSPALALAASFAFAFMHGGMWAKEELSRPYCEPCRRSTTRLAAVMTAVILFFAGIGGVIWLRGPGP